MGVDMDRFWSKVDRRGDDDCWPWLAAMHHGYGVFWWQGRMKQAHRIAYELLVGPIPDGMQIDHLCRNRWCQNPRHHEPVTQQENWVRGEAITAIKSRQTHCIAGHEFSDENTYVYRGWRKCRACKRRRDSESRAARRVRVRE